jgi:iron complex transport system substrate-binding protein
LPQLFSEVLGKEVRVPDDPRRIVSFSPAATEALFMIGEESSLAGVSAFCARPEGAKSKRRVGSYNSVREDVLRGIDPDLIITVTGYQREFARALSERWPVYPLELPVSVAGIVDFVVKIGLLSGAQDRARELAATLIRAVPRPVSGPRPRCYVEADLGGPVSFGALSYITDAVRLVGGSTLFDEVRKEWLTPDLGSVRSLDPDLIVYEPKMFSRFGQGDMAALLRRRGWEEMRAVKSRRCFMTPGPLDFIAHHGPSFITQVLPWLADVMGPDGDRSVGGRPTG